MLMLHVREFISHPTTESRIMHCTNIMRQSVSEMSRTSKDDIDAVLIRSGYHFVIPF